MFGVRVLVLIVLHVFILVWPIFFCVGAGIVSVYCFVNDVLCLRFVFNVLGVFLCWADFFVLVLVLAVFCCWAKCLVWCWCFGVGLIWVFCLCLAVFLSGVSSWEVV